MRSQEKHQVHKIIQEINSLVQKQEPQALDASSRGGNSAYEKMRKRLITNKAIVQVLSDFSGLSKESIVDDLALKTKGSTMDEELYIAVLQGISLLGTDFERAITQEIRKQLYGAMST